MISEFDFKNKVAKNITRYRKESGLTQGMLAEKLNYSDKSVSKWERGDGLPDIYVLKQMAEILGVSLSDILGEEASAKPEEKDTPKKKKARRAMIVTMSIGLCWLTASVLFYILKILPFDIPKTWSLFLIAIPASFIVLLVFSCIWYGTVARALSVSGIIWTVTIPIMVFGASGKFAFIYIVCAIMQVLTILWFINRHFFRKPMEEKEKGEETQE